MATEKALQRAAQAWCEPSTEKKVMDPALAEIFAGMLDEAWAGCSNPNVGLKKRIRDAINYCCAENGSNTPDFILAEYLLDCLAAFDKASRARDDIGLAKN